MSQFLVAPLAKSAGGSQKCSKPVFESKQDPDYQAILATFRPISEMLARRPRIDMPGGNRPRMCAGRTSKNRNLIVLAVEVHLEFGRGNAG